MLSGTCRRCYRAFNDSDAVNFRVLYPPQRAPIRGPLRPNGGTGRIRRIVQQFSSVAREESAREVCSVKLDVNAREEGEDSVERKMGMFGFIGDARRGLKW